MTTATRIFNFSSGPAVLPVEVLQQAQRDLLALPGVGMSVMEISHRSKPFEDILNTAVANIRQLANVPSNYKVLMLQGGASLQFSMVPMNLLTPGATADYIDSGSWADKAIKEAKKVGHVNVSPAWFEPSSSLWSLKRYFTVMSADFFAARPSFVRPSIWTSIDSSDVVSRMMARCASSARSSTTD